MDDYDYLGKEVIMAGQAFANSRKKIDTTVNVAFIYGAKWKSDQQANEAIDFAEWIESCPFMYKELYELWKSKSK